MDIAGGKEFDVIVVGAGNAATCAALSAREPAAPGSDGRRRLRPPRRPERGCEGEGGMRRHPSLTVLTLGTGFAVCAARTDHG